jgi:hypothetical protein
MSELHSKTKDSPENNKKSTQQNENHHATTQIGGKGTVRRRRIRKTKVKHSNQHENFNQNLKINFLNKFKLQDDGKLEGFSLVHDNGTVKSFTASSNSQLNFSANYEKNFYCMHLNSLPTAPGKPHSLNYTLTTIDEILADFNRNTSERSEVYTLLGIEFSTIIRNRVSNMVKV